MGLFLAHSRFQLPVAGKTYIRAAGQEQVFQLRLVRIVTLRAFIRYQGFVRHLGCLHSLLQIAMARYAQCALFSGEDPRDIASMSIVTGKAFPLRKRYMVGAILRLFH